MQLEYFQLLDRVSSIDLDRKTIVATATVPLSSTIFEGHFPGYPLMPGVLLIETMAQTSGWLLLAISRFKQMPFLAAVKEAKLRNFVQPGEVLTIEATVKHEGSGFAMTDAQIKVDGKLTSNATLTFRQVTFPNDNLRGHMDKVAERIGMPLPSVQNG